jgi:hypothetical protein
VAKDGGSRHVVERTRESWRHVTLLRIFFFFFFMRIVRSDPSLRVYVTPSGCGFGPVPKVLCGCALPSPWCVAGRHPLRPVACYNSDGPNWWPAPTHLYRFASRPDLNMSPWPPLLVCSSTAQTRLFFFRGSSSKKILAMSLV